MVGDENQHGSRVGVLAVLLNRSQFLVVRSAPEQVLDATDKKHLKGRHQRRRASAIEDFRQVGFGEIQLEQTEITQVGRD